MGILRLSHVDITVPDLDLASAYYTDVMGMIEVERTSDRAFFKCWDEEDHHSLAVRYDPRVGIDRFSFKVEDDDDLADLEARVEKFGFRVDRVSRGEEIGQGESIRFATPSGHTMELVREVEQVGGLLPKVNPPPVPLDLPGIAPPRMDHLLVTAEEVGEATRFYTDVLGFRITEQLLDGDGHQIGTWLERSHSPHDLAVVSGPNGGLHHFAFWLDAWDDVRRSADILAYHAVQIDVGPTRHGITRGSTIYFFDPMGTRNEVFTGGYRPDPDFPTITWTEDNIGKAIFYYEGELNERFMKVHT
ncbi:catechol 2,3-dioxygenase [Candidatus Spongiisocius sp.]|uniref:catechol 2,3-dioxygenase n=1 Tax=Candidatus Spongiisocius sp. TaxID=3101273 RepID=UPI003B5937C9